MVFSHLLQAAILLLVGTLLYCLLFWRSTFLRWNRVLLWSILLASLILPFVHLPASWTLQGWQNKVTTSLPVTRLNADEKLPEPQFFTEINLSEQETPSETSEVISTKHPIVPITQLLFLFYGLGRLVFGIRFLIHLLSLFKLFRNAHIEERDGYQLAFCREELSPFAFGYTIFLSEALLQSEDLELILTHELAHVRQQHTLDILAAELLLVWQWFNPGAWLYRRLVETNLEYLADRSVLQQQWNKKQYQLSLLHWSNSNVSNRLSTSYNFSLLKERIMMMNRKPSSKVYFLGYAMILSLLPILSVFNQPAFVQAAAIDSDQGPKFPLDYKKANTDLNLEANESVQAPSSEARQTKAPSKPSISSIITHTESSESKTDSSEFFIVIGPNATESEMEKLSEMSFPLDRKLILDRNADNKLIGYTLKGKGSASGNSMPIGEDRLPSVLFGKKGSTGGEDQLSLEVLDVILAADWDKTKIYCVGLPATKEAIAALRPKALAIYEAGNLRRLIQLKALNWVHTYEKGHMTYTTFTEKTLNHLKGKVQKCTEGNLGLIVTINGGAPQNTLPVLENLKLSRIEAHDKIAHYYQENTTKLIKEEPAGLRLEIFTEQ
ncbi:M56 family metallopeptidase [Haliscomenobacter sp.]|uniref:M56 family metallopeptidase n=1 Tax=Haliscomenobacter sp. TaxID=2717303 RepID=UPI003594253C